MKALAGVALIGAAAALASNPVLLPIGIVAGRRKRSESFPEEEPIDFQMDYILNTLKGDLAKVRTCAIKRDDIISRRNFIGHARLSLFPRYRSTARAIDCSSHRAASLD